MAGRFRILLSFPVVMGLLVALTVGLILLGREIGLGLSTLFLLAVPLVLAAVYLAWYSTLPYTPRPARSGPPPVPSVPPSAVDEPFEDPVEEADRWDELKEEDEVPEEPKLVPDEDDEAPAKTLPGP